MAAAPFQAPAAAAGCPPARVPPSADYLNLVTRYAAGEYTPSITALGKWSDETLKCDLDNLQAAAVAFKRCPTCDDRVVFERFSVRAALLLHADREMFDGFGSPVSEQPVTCGTGKNAAVVQRLSSMLLLVDPEAKDFLRRFYVAIARHAQWCHCLRESQDWARAGLKWLPQDGALLLTQGIAADAVAALTNAPSPRTAGMTSRAKSQLESQERLHRDMWEGVRRTYEEAVAADPSQAEAKLRLGRAWWRLRKPEAARARFEEVLAQTQDKTLLHLAHLSLGRVHEEAGRLSEAEAEYRAALALEPLAEPAGVALSHIRLLQGDPDGAREVLDSVMAQAGKRTGLDSYKRYLMAHTVEGQDTLVDLRLSVAR